MKRDSNKFKNMVIFSALCSLILTGCMINKQESYEKVPVDDLMMIKEDKTLYEEPMEKSVLYLTVGWNSEGKSSDYYSWKDINSHDLDWYDETDEPIHYCEARVQFGNEDGPVSTSYGYGNVSPNAVVKLKGHKASTRPQKSYLVKINSGSGNISGIKSFALNKCFGDPFRFLNKLSYDLMSDTDELLSVRSEFVHLYVKDKSLGDDALFEDYGLYTMTETVNKRYLSNRSFDKSGELYEVEDFDFTRHKDIIMQPTEAGFDKDSFEELLEVEGSNDYTKLINMLDALNSSNSDIKDIVNTYFDEDNLYTWMAFNILMDNKDTDTEKFYLYSPTGVDKFFIIPGDMDGSLRSDHEIMQDPKYSPGWEKGIFLYNDSLLFSRIMKNDHCVSELSERIKYLHESVLSAENVGAKSKELSAIVKERLYMPPDVMFARVTSAGYDELLSKIPEQMDNNYYAYYDSLLTPWPFHIKEPTVKDGHVILSWDESYILEGNITYDVELSRSWDFASLTKADSDLTATSIDVGALNTGQYFVRVRAKADNDTEQIQEAYEYYNTEKGSTVHGVMCFYVNDDGTVTESVF